jgi:predicted RNase H-like nuclease (RuvC/YqgF family)
MNTLFDSDPLFRVSRDCRGRFATAERAEYDRAKKENRMLRLQVERYRREAEILSKSNCTLQHEVAGLKQQLTEARALLNV